MGKIKKPIVVTNDDSNYKIIINPDGSIYVFSKNYNGNIFNIIPNGLNINISANNGAGIINIHDIVKLVSKSHKKPIYDANYNTFTASGFKLTYGTNEQVLLGDGSTTGKLVKDIRVNQADINKKNTLMVTVQYIDGTALGTELPKATIESAGVMTADDKAKLDAVKNTYLPLSGGRMTGVLDIDFTEGIQIIEYDLNPRNTYIGNGSIRIESLDGDTSRVNSKTEIDSNSITTTNATVADKVKANGFLANNNGNGYTAWTTNGGNINLLTLLSNAAIYVAGGFELVGANVNNTTVIDNPDNIIFSRTGRFLAKKDSVYYTHWNADISKNIAPPSRYGIETDNGVFPFNNQMYKFSDQDDIYIAVCSNSSCIMKVLTLE